MFEGQTDDKIRRYAWVAVPAEVVALGTVSAVWAVFLKIRDAAIRNGMIYDGSRAKPYLGDFAIDSDRITYVGKPRVMKGRVEIDAHGQAVSPGFIDMMGHSIHPDQ
jgi:adenine deaminase